MKYLAKTLLFGKISTMYPYEPKTRTFKLLWEIWKIFIAVPVFVYLFQAIFKVFRSSDIDLRIDGLKMLSAAVYIGCTTCVLYYRLKAEKLKEIVESVERNFAFDSEWPGDDKETMKTVEFWDKAIPYYYNVQVAFSTTFMAVWTLFSSTERLLPLPAAYPYDSTKTPYYQLTILLQLFTNISMGLIYAQADLIILPLTLHVKSQFRILGCNLRNVLYTSLLRYGIDADEVEAFRGSFPFGGEHPLLRRADFKRVVEEKLRQYIEQHKMLLKVCEEMEEFFWPISGVKILLGMFFVIFSVFMIVKSPYNSHIANVGLTLYLFEASFGIFCITTSGEMLLTENDNLHRSIYGVPWYLCRPKVRWGVLMMQIRCKRGSKLTAAKLATCNMALFLTIFKSAASYYTVLTK